MCTPCFKQWYSDTKTPIILSLVNEGGSWPRLITFEPEIREIGEPCQRWHVDDLISIEPEPREIGEPASGTRQRFDLMKVEPREIHEPCQWWHVFNLICTEVEPREMDELCQWWHVHDFGFDRGGAPETEPCQWCHVDDMIVIEAETPEIHEPCQWWHVHDLIYRARETWDEPSCQWWHVHDRIIMELSFFTRSNSFLIISLSWLSKASKPVLLCLNVSRSLFKIWQHHDRLVETCQCLPHLRNENYIALTNVSIVVVILTSFAATLWELSPGLLISTPSASMPTERRKCPSKWFFSFDFRFSELSWETVVLDRACRVREWVGKRPTCEWRRRRVLIIINNNRGGGKK